MSVYLRGCVLSTCAIHLLQDKRKTVEGARSTFMSAMSDAGLKPTVVYHNLTPAELYEKVCTQSDDTGQHVLPASICNGLGCPGRRTWQPLSAEA
jgi:hypothetical protein